MASGIAFGGRGLHSGRITSVVLVRRAGPIAIRQAGCEVSLDALGLARHDYGVAVQAEGIRVDLAEHVMAAVGGMRVERDLRVDVFGPEVPLLDGGASRFAMGLRQLGFAKEHTARRAIARAFDFRLGSSFYRLRPAFEVHLSVDVVFDHPLISGTKAVWKGDSEDFRRRIAPARTFGFRRDAERLLRAGRANGVDLRSVVVLDDDGTSPSTPPPLGDECARHKLLDLIGDLTLDGGVPRGRIHALRPGHGATHAMLKAAKQAGVFRDDVRPATIAL